MKENPKPKRCTKCDALKARSEFARTPRTKDGFAFWCKECHSADYRAKREQRLAQQRKYREPRRAELAAKSRAYREANIEQSRRRNREWKLRNPERVRAHALAYMHKLRGGGAIDPEYALILRADICSYCGDRSGPDTPTMQVDHIEAVNSGGTGSWENLTAACYRCNRRKSDKPLLVALLDAT